MAYGYAQKSVIIGQKVLLKKPETTYGYTLTKFGSVKKMAATIGVYAKTFSIFGNMEEKCSRRPLC